MKIVMITPLDYSAAFNNREHNAVRYYVAAGDEVTVVGKTFNRRSGVAAMAVDLLSHRVRKSRVDGADIHLVDPMLNIYGGLARRHLGAEGGVATAQESAFNRCLDGAKRGVVRALRPLSILREVPVVIGVTVTAWRAAKGADVAMAFGPWGAVPAYVLRKFGRVRCFAYIDRDYEAGLVEGARGRLTAWLEKVLPARADVLVSIGPRLQALRHRTTGKKPLLSPTGVNYDRFALPRQPSGPFEILYVGNVVEWAGVELAMEALARATAKDLRLTIIGTGQDSYIAQLKALAETLGITNRTQFVGAVPHSDLPQHLTSASIGLAMSRPNLYRTYAYPLKVLEYMAAGLVVLATQETETGDIVRRAQAGKTLPFDVATLAACFDQLAGAPEQVAALSKSGQRAARAMSWEVSLDVERTALGSALAGGGGMSGLRIGLDARPYLKTRTGVERFAEQIALGMKSADPDVSLVFFADQPLEPAVKARLPGQFVEVPPPRLLPRGVFDFWITRALPPHLKAAGIDVFYSISTKFPFGDVPVVTTVHGMEWFAWPKGYSRVERLKQAFWMRQTLKRAARIVTFAKSSQADIARFSSRGGSKLRLASEAAAAHFVQRDVDGADPFFLIVGSLELRKNLDRVLDAYATYAETEAGQVLPLKIVGKDAWRSDALRARVRDLGLGDRVTFLGFVPDEELVTLYNQCRALVFLSLYEGFGLPIVEGMACGAAVLTSNVSSMPEVAGHAACVIDPQDKGAITAALRRLTHDMNYVAALQKAGPVRAAHYSWHRAGREVLDVVKEAAHDR